MEGKLDEAVWLHCSMSISPSRLLKETHQFVKLAARSLTPQLDGGRISLSGIVLAHSQP